MAGVYALKYPQHVKKLILASPCCLPHKVSSKWAESWTWRGRMLFGAFNWLMYRGMTPQLFVRLAGPWGRRLTDGYVYRRFPDHFDPYKPAVAEYAYHMTAAPPSGEYALGKVFADLTGQGRDPLGPRLLAALAVPVGFIYGTHDWMGPHYADAVAGDLVKRGLHACVYRVPMAGHQLAIENPPMFLEAVVQFCDSIKAP